MLSIFNAEAEPGDLTDLQSVRSCSHTMRPPSGRGDTSTTCGDGSKVEVLTPESSPEKLEDDFRTFLAIPGRSESIFQQFTP
jgi:hypothetical protein